MLSYCVKSLKRKFSHYIHFDILLLWVLGLWIALCANNMHCSDSFIRAAKLVYETDWSFGIKSAYNIATMSETMENMSYIAAPDNDISILRCIRVLLFFFFVIALICIYEHRRKKIIVLKNVFQRLSDSYKSFRCFKNTTHPFNKETLSICRNNRNVSQPKIILSFGIIKETIRYTTTAEINESRFNYEYANINFMENKIILSGCTSLILRNYGLYSYFYRMRFIDIYKNHYLNYLMRQNTNCVKSHFTSPNKGGSDKRVTLKIGALQRRAISSSPEFKEFVANFVKSDSFCPCILQVSRNYVIRVKSICV